MKRVSRIVAKVDDITPDIGHVVTLDEEGQECVLFLHENAWYAVGSLCPHQNASLGNAPICDGLIVCRRHSFRFDLKTGDCRTLGGYGLPIYPVHTEGEDVIVTYWKYD